VKIETLCVHSSDSSDLHGAMVEPIYQTVTFRQVSATGFGEYDYTRTANPTRHAVERHLARLEGAADCAVFGSGMAALAAVMSLLHSGDHVIAGLDLYGGTVRLLEQVVRQRGVSVEYVDCTNGGIVARTLRPQTRLILVETPSNPQLRSTDIASLADLARAQRAWLAVDNSMLTPLGQRPLAHGADLVIHSATKFLSGHSDVTAGAVMTNDPALHREITFHQNAEGAGLCPFESWLLLRGVKTLALRVERQWRSAARVAEYLAAHAQVQEVVYPGLPDYRDRDVHLGQARAGGAIVCFRTGDTGRSRSLVEALRLFAIAVSFGSITSTVCLPFFSSHASIPTVLAAQAPPPDLVRLSIGIEDCDDLIDDLAQALARTGERRRAHVEA
jgi:cystathionine beta-lyase